MQTTGDRVRVRVELAARVQLGHDHLDGRHALLVHLDGNTAAVIDDLDAAVLEQRDLHARGVPGHGLIDRVVHDLPDQVVQTPRAGGADVHARTHPDGLEPLEDGDR